MVRHPHGSIFQHSGLLRGMQQQTLSTQIAIMLTKMLTKNKSPVFSTCLRLLNQGSNPSSPAIARKTSNPLRLLVFPYMSMFSQLFSIMFSHKILCIRTRKNANVEHKMLTKMLTPASHAPIIRRDFLFRAAAVAIHQKRLCHLCVIVRAIHAVLARPRYSSVATSTCGSLST